MTSMNTPETPQSQAVDTPLGPDDFDAQDAVLDQLRATEEDTPDWEFCEGFLAALVCTRREVPPAEYWPPLLGDSFKPMENMEFVLRWKRRWAEVAAALDADDVEVLDDERAYQPAAIDVRGGLLSLPEAERGGAVVADLPSFAETWSHGFMHAVQVFADDWAPPRDREAAEMLAEGLADVEALLAPDTGAPILSMHSEDGPPSVSQRRIDNYGSALWAVYDLRKLWKSLGPRVVSARKTDEPGRNDLCHCGSGKKFKKCHGA